MFTLEDIIKHARGKGLLVSLQLKKTFCTSANLWMIIYLAVSILFMAASSADWLRAEDAGESFFTQTLVTSKHCFYK
jgi:hypothetical protein